jgi:hypothetical protein
MSDTTPEVTSILNDKFVSKEKFAEEIEQVVIEKDMNYIDAIIEYCSENNIEIETINKVMSKVLKEKLRADAMGLNYLKKTTQAKLTF